MANKTKSVSEEREYTIPLRFEIAKVPRHKRTPKAIKAIKQFVAKHMRVPDRDVNKVKLDKWLNEAVWSRGIKKPLTKVKVKVRRQDGNVIVQLAELPEHAKYAIAREEKMKKASEKVKDKKSKEVKADKEENTEEEKKEEKEKLESAMEVKEMKAEQQAKEAKHMKKEISPKAVHRKAMKK